MRQIRMLGNMYFIVIFNFFFDNDPEILTLLSISKNQIQEID